MTCVASPTPSAKAASNDARNALGRRARRRHGPLAAPGEVRERANYGNEATGAHLERKFGSPPYGAPVEVVQALIAGAIRGGHVNVVHQGARISRADDPRLERVFRTLPTFRAASFTPPVDEGPDLPTRTSLAEKLGALTGTRPAVASRRWRRAFASDSAPKRKWLAASSQAYEDSACAYPIRSPGPPTSSSVFGAAQIPRLGYRAQTWTDLVSGCESVSELARVLEDDLEAVQAAKREVDLEAAALKPNSSASSGNCETCSRAVILPTTSHGSGLSRLGSPTLAGRCERKRSPSCDSGSGRDGANPRAVCECRRSHARRSSRDLPASCTV